MRAYVVWLPVLPSAFHEAAARREGLRIGDPRALHFYDPQAKLAKLFSAAIHRPPGGLAWDVYLVFGPSARWDEEPPAPTYWMHQLGTAPSELRLDGAKLAHVVEGLLAGKGTGGLRPPAKRSTMLQDVILSARGPGDVGETRRGEALRASRAGKNRVSVSPLVSPWGSSPARMAPPCPSSLF